MSADVIAGAAVLDVGCGSGEMSQRLESLGAQVTGVDLSLAGLHKSPIRGNVAQVDLEDGLPFLDDSFDVVWCTEVLEHMNSPGFLLRECRRLLRDEGLLLLTVPNSAFYVFRLLHLLGKTCSDLQHPGHLHFFSHSSLKRLLEEHHFVIDRPLLGRGIYFMWPFHLAGPLRTIAARRAEAGKLSGLIAEDTLTRGPLVTWVSYTSIAAPFWADTFIVIAKKDGTGERVGQ
jgi:SAM-dependent methyltransferase